MAQLKDAISELSPEITKINELLPNTAIYADLLKTHFDTLKTSVVDLEAEGKALSLINTELHGGLSDTTAMLETQAHQADLVWGSWKQVGEATKSVDDIFRDLRPSLEDVYVSLSDNVNVALGDTFTKLGDIKTANTDPFDDLTTDGNEFYDALDKPHQP